MTIFLAVVVVAAVATAGVKWLRVIQREHYLPGSTITMYGIWTSSSIPNKVLVALPFLSLVLGLAANVPEAMTVLSSVAVAVFPLGLSLRGRTSTLAWTDRLKRLASIIALLCVTTIVVLSALGLVFSRAALVMLAAFPLLLEVAMRIAFPMEYRLSQWFADGASETLGRIDPTVVAITGSYAKTSTKGYVQHLVEGSRRVIASPASFNNRLGLARAINEDLADDAEVFVAEMGTYGPGEIADLCGWIHPEVAVITAIGPVHLQRFKTESNILAAKSEILVGARAAVLNVDHEGLAALADQTKGMRVWRCGAGSEAIDVRVSGPPGELIVEVDGRSIGKVTADGVFAANLACAVAVALELGVTEAEILERGSQISPPAHRQTISTSDAGFIIIDDTFNSNPSGAARALDVLAGQGGPQARRVVVTPGMVELGPRQFDENRAFGAAASVIADDVVVVGHTNRSALRKGTEDGKASVIVVATRQEAVEWVRARLGHDDVVLYENDLPDHYP